MTHEELLAKIKTVIELTDEYDHYLKGAPINWDAPLAGLVALRAVVELHKPVYVESFTGRTDLCCSDCQLDEYPCSTIQAIEKELK